MLAFEYFSPILLILAVIGELLVSWLMPNKLWYMKSPNFTFNAEGYLLIIESLKPEKKTSLRVTQSNIKLCNRNRNIEIGLNNVLLAECGYRKPKYWLIVAIIMFILAFVMSFVSGGMMDIIDVIYCSVPFLFVYFFSPTTAYIAIKVPTGEYYGVCFKKKEVDRETLDKVVYLINERIVRGNNQSLRISI